jgi:hypothetical protein
MTSQNQTAKDTDTLTSSKADVAAKAAKSPDAIRELTDDEIVAVAGGALGSPRLGVTGGAGGGK